MTDNDKQTQHEANNETRSAAPRRVRPALIAMLMIAAIIAVAAVWIASSNDPEPEPPGTTTAIEASTSAPTTTVAAATISDEEIARTFIDATSTGDPSVAISLLDPGAFVDLGGLSSAADAAAWFEWNRAMGFATAATECEAPSAGTIRCEYTYSSAWMTDGGDSPVAGNSMTFRIVDQRITNVAESLNFDRFAPAWGGFKAWLDRSHPGSLAQILNADDTPILTRESLDSWQRYSDEFIASFDLEALGDRLLDAFLTFDPSQLETVAPTARDIHEEQYLQEWSVATAYQVTDRNCEPTVRRVACTIEGTDDLGDVLGLSYVDIFTIAVRDDGTISNIIWATDSVPAGALEEFNNWIRATDPDLFQTGGACEGFFDRGQTPAECARAWISAAPEYLETLEA